MRLMWAARAVWAAVGVVAPWGPVAQGRSAPVSTVLQAWGWTSWLVVMVALFVPAALSLTVVRILVPAVTVTVFLMEGVLWPFVAVVVARVLLSRHVADVLVQGSAYGAETRCALRTPVPYLAPAVLVGSALVASSVGGTLLLDGADVLVQASAHGARHGARVHTDGTTARLTWERPQRRVSPGQSVVFYDTTDTFVLGGGVVTDPG
ncbi:MAG: aminomethyltransferase beta-barrel domain-containing protein [Actinomycetota bacterium]